jgi:hypothetical protein
MTIRVTFERSKAQKYLDFLSGKETISGPIELDDLPVLAAACLDRLAEGCLGEFPTEADRDRLEHDPDAIGEAIWERCRALTEEAEAAVGFFHSLVGMLTASDRKDDLLWEREGLIGQSDFDSRFDPRVRAEFTFTGTTVETTPLEGFKPDWDHGWEKMRPLRDRDVDQEGDSDPSS